MSDDCENCGAAIRLGSTFKEANERKSAGVVAWVNALQNTDYGELCTKCGIGPLDEARMRYAQEIERRANFIQERIADFPMFTTSWFPPAADVKLKNLITANVTVGTGIFSELSQGISDLIGAVNVNSGMALKINKGEAAARSILVTKAMSLGANCIVGVDIDYGTPGNNAATVNMQGTAAVISNLESVMHADDFKNAQDVAAAFKEIADLRQERADHWSA